MTAAKSVSATFTAAGTPGTLTFSVVGRGAVSTSAGACASTGGTKTCVQHFKAGATAVAHGEARGGAVVPRLERRVHREEDDLRGEAGDRAVRDGDVQQRRRRRRRRSRSLGRPIVVKTSTGYRVTLRFVTTKGGTARVRGIRGGPRGHVRRREGGRRPRPHRAVPGSPAGPLRRSRSGSRASSCGHAGLPRRAAGRPRRRRRSCSPASRRRSPGRATSGRSRCTPARTRSTTAGSAPSAERGCSSTSTSSAAPGRVAFGPFLLGPGNYTLRLAGVDGYGRARTLSWIVSLGPLRRRDGMVVVPVAGGRVHHP